MRVLFDARPGEANLTGIGRYARTTAALLDRGVPGHDVVLLGGGSGLATGATSPVEEELCLPSLLEREEADVFHSPFFQLPAILPARTIVTIHDAIPVVRPELTSAGFARLFDEAGDAAQRADLVVCPSESAKADVVRALGVPADRVEVVPECPAALFLSARTPDRSAARRRHELEDPFVLVVGSLERRKNPGVVLDALARLTDTSLQAVFVGPEAGFDLVAVAAERGLASHVRHLGVVSDEDLVDLYAGALALVFPSLYEGFGLPVVEAFACDTPVVASNAASVPEVAGDAALLFPPEDPKALADALERLAASPELRDDLAKRGRARLERFTPDVVRRRLGEVYARLEGASP